MESFTYDDALSVGNKKIDEQHKEIVHWFSQLKQHIPTGSDSEHNLHATLSNLIILMTKHFIDEEELMYRNGCPRYEVHMRQHGFFIEQLSQALLMNEAEILHQGIPMLADRMMEHMISEDMACRSYFVSDLH